MPNQLQDLLKVNHWLFQHRDQTVALEAKRIHNLGVQVKTSVLTQERKDHRREIQLTRFKIQKMKLIAS